MNSSPRSGLPAARCGGLCLSPGLSSPVARRFYSGVEKRLSRQSHKLEKAGSTPAAATALLIRRLIERLERYPLPRFDRHLTRSVP